MITREMIERINHLARKSRTEGLTPAEKLEQTRLRRLYIDAIKAQVRQALEQMSGDATGKHGRSCSCPGCHGHRHH